MLCPLRFKAMSLEIISLTTKVDKDNMKVTEAKNLC